MSLMERANKAARLHSYLRERGGLKAGFSFFLIVSPQVFRSRRKWALWKPVLGETGSGSRMHWRKAGKKARESRHFQGFCNNQSLEMVPEALGARVLVGPCRVWKRASEIAYCSTGRDRRSYRTHSKSNQLNSLLSYSQERGQKKRRENNLKKGKNQSQRINWGWGIVTPDQSMASGQDQTGQKPSFPFILFVNLH